VSKPRKRLDVADEKPLSIYVAINMHWESLEFVLPAPPESRRWHLVLNTAAGPEDIFESERELELSSQDALCSEGRSTVVLISK
jgi:glycogen operon protein